MATAPYWDSHSTQEQFSHLVGQLEHQNAPINYSVFQNGNHMYTWTIAYIPGIRDWVYLKAGRTSPFSSKRTSFPPGRNGNWPASC